MGMTVNVDSVVGNMNYSTTEQKTGQKWIDGKPIYRIAINTHGPSNVGVLEGIYTNENLIANIDTIISINGTSTNSTGTSIIPVNWWINEGFFAVWVDINSRQILAETSVATRLANSKVNIILEYTKKTD